MLLNILLIGAPGSGKGTQGSLISDSFGISVVSTGDILRQEVLLKTPLGLKAQEFMNAGLLVPDACLLDIISSNLQSKECQAGFILDGFPRNIDQAVYLDSLLKKINKSLHHVFFFDIDTSILVDRILKRAVVENRSDDTEVTIKNRLSVFTEKTLPILSYYENQNILRKINANNTVEAVKDLIFDYIYNKS